MSISNASNSQEIFLQNDFLSIGINGSGTLGTKTNAPTGIYADLANGFSRVGIVGDTDGFGVGGTATRDAVLPGTAIETFAVGYKIGATKYVKVNSERDAKKDIAGVASNLSDADHAAAGWTGTTGEGVKVKQVMSMTEDAKFVKVEITLTNTGSAAVTDLRYMRSIDPDHGSSFATNNVVVEQGKDGSNGALVAAYASKTSTPFYFYSQDDRAVVSTYGVENFDPYAAAAYDKPQAEGYAVSGDTAININFGLGALAAGASTTITYYMGITDNLASTIAAINAQSDQPAPPVPEPVVNYAPTATNDALTVAAGLKGIGNVLTNDTDANGDSLSAAVKTGPSNGTVSVNANGTYEYTPKAGFSGNDSFTYTVSDGKATSTATVNVTVTPPPNLAPVANGDSLAVVAGNVGTGNVLTNDTDPNGDALSATLKTGPANGTVTLASNGAYQYTPKAGFTGSDTFTYTVSDGKATSTGTVSVTVAPPPNAAPEAQNDALSLTAGTTATGNVLANDTDANGDALKATLKTGPAHGSVSLAADGSFSYTPTAGYTGADSFTYTASDGKASDVGTVNVTVVAKPNNGPVAVGESFSAEHGAVVTGNVLTNDSDIDGDALHAAVVAGPAHGTLSIADNGAFTYVPAAGFAGMDTFTYAANDGKGSASATVTINVAPAPVVVEPPVVELPVVEPPVPSKPEPVLHDASPAGTQVMIGTAGQDKFFFDVAAKSGADIINNFGGNDLIVTSAKLYDGNNDGVISFQANKLSIDAPKTVDTVLIGGVSALRLMGQDADGNFLYANAATMPKATAISTTYDNAWKADAKDAKAETFFFDSALDINFGADKISSFGNKDTIVTTSALKLDSSGKAVATGGEFQLGDSTHDLGGFALTDLKGGAVSQLDFNGSVDHGGMTYYVYSLTGSTAFHTVSF